MTIGEALRLIREVNHTSVRQASAAIEVDIVLYGEYERGKKNVPAEIVHRVLRTFPKVTMHQVCAHLLQQDKNKENLNKALFGPGGRYDDHTGQEGSNPHDEPQEGQQGALKT